MTTATKTKPKKSADDKLREELRVIKQKRIAILEQKDRYVTTHLWEYFKPFRWQVRCRDMVKDKLIVIAPAPNKIGKTALVVCIIISWLRGYEAWNPVDADYPGAVKHDNKWYKPSSLEIKPPVRIRLTGEDWRDHLGQTVVPEISKWFPMEDFHVKNHETGTPCLYTDKKTGSTLALLTHGMEDAKYESWGGDGWIPDEPPPDKKYKAMQRGLYGRRGKTLIPTTPLKEAWMLDELVLKNRSEVGVMKDLCCLDNEIFYNADDETLTEMGLSGKRTKYWQEAEGQKKTFFDLIMRRDLYVDLGDDGAGSGPPDDQGESAEKFLRENTPEETHDRIMDLKFLKWAKDTSVDEKPSRGFGLFKELVGLVVKEFNKPKHIVPDFKIPTDWPVSFQIDFHLSLPVAIAFYACDEHNRHFVIDEVWENTTPEEIAALIIRKKKVECWNIEHGEIDPLSKGDVKYIKNRGIDIDDAFSVIEEKLEAEGIEFNGAIKDPTSGFINIKKWLKGPNKIPILYFFNSLQSVKDNRYGHVHEIQRLCYDDNGDVKKKNDHFMECLYRYTLMGVKYSEPRKPSRESASDGTEGGWLGT